MIVHQRRSNHLVMTHQNNSLWDKHRAKQHLVDLEMRLMNQKSWSKSSSEFSLLESQTLSPFSKSFVMWRKNQSSCTLLSRQKQSASAFQPMTPVVATLSGSLGGGAFALSRFLPFCQVLVCGCAWVSKKSRRGVTFQVQLLCFAK